MCCIVVKKFKLFTNKQVSNEMFVDWKLCLTDSLLKYDELCHLNLDHNDIRKFVEWWPIFSINRIIIDNKYV